MNKIVKRTISLFLSTMLLVTSLCTTAYAAGTKPGDSGAVWTQIDVNQLIQPGSALDLSFLNTGNNSDTINQAGFVKINDNGDYYFGDDPANTVRFVGANVMDAKDIISKDAADTIARQFAALGYNSVRIQSQEYQEYNVDNGSIYTIPTGSLYDENDPLVLNFNEGNLDKLDYLVHAFKEQGIYITLTLMYRFDMSHVKEIADLLSSADLLPDKTISSYTCRNLFLYTQEGRDLWKVISQKLLEHENPYTGMKYKDDPVFIGIDPVNETVPMVSTFWSDRLDNTEFKARILSDYNEVCNTSYVEFSEIPTGIWDSKGDELAKYFSAKMEEAFTDAYDFLKEIGVRAPIGGIGFWNSPMVNAWRQVLDVHETHDYSFLNDEGYPGGTSYPLTQAFTGKLNNGSEISSYSNYFPSLSLSQTYGKPFALTEYNHSSPAYGRDDLGVVIGSMASFQGWDLLSQFIYSAGGSLTNLFKTPKFGAGLGFASDPLAIASVYESNLLSRTNSVTQTDTKFVIVRDYNYMLYNKNASYDKEGVGNLLYVSHLFNTPTVYIEGDGQTSAAVYKIPSGNTVEEAIDNPDNRLNIPSTMTRAQAAQVFIDALEDNTLKGKLSAALASNKLLSDTEELLFDLNTHTYSVTTPRVASVAGILENQTFTLGELQIADVTTDRGTITAASLDGKDLNESERTLLIYTTELKTATETRTEGKKYDSGAGPILALKGTATITLSNVTDANHYIAYKLNQSGTRAEIIPVTAESDSISFDITTDKGFYFELVKLDTPAVPDTTPPTAPNNLQVKALCPVPSELNLTWEPATDASGIALYRVYKGGEPVAETSGYLPPAIEGVMGTGVNIQGLTLGETYSFTIEAVDIAGNVSSQSTPMEFTVPSVLAYDDFEDGDAIGWRTSLFSSFDATNANFEVVDLEGNKVFTNTTQLRSNTANMSALKKMRNGMVSGMVRFDTLTSAENAAVGISGRRVSWSEGYMLIYYVNQHKLVLAKGQTDAPNVSELKSVKLELPANKYHDFALFFNENTIKAYINGEEKIQVTDSTYLEKDLAGTLNGVVAVFTFYGQKAYFDEILVDPRMEFNVTYDTNGGTGDVPTDSINHANGANVAVKFDTIPSREGYTFSGWATAKDATVAEYTENGTNTFPMGIKDVILYAKWTADKATLIEMIAEAEALDESAYTADTWAALEAALEEAGAVKDDTAATPEQVNEAVNALSTAISELVEKADTTALEGKIGEAEALSEAEYTPASWSVLQSALAAAEAVLGDGNATQAEVDAAVEEVDTAILGLVQKADMTDLLEKIAEAEGLNGAEYTPASWNALQSALTAAKAVLDDENATQAEVNAAVNALSVAINELVPIPVSVPADKEELSEKIAGAEGLNGAEYTPASWSMLQSALTAAKTVFDDENATQAEVDAAVSALNTAISELVPIPIFVPADKEELSDKVAEAEVLSETEYTPASWSALQSALTAAKTVLGNENATQAEVDAAVEALNAAMDGLVKAENLVKYTVTFNSNSGSAVAAITNVTSGSAITAPAAPTRAGYTFAGWYKEESLTTAWNFTTDRVTANITLYAKWTQNPSVPSITYYTITASAGEGGKISPQTSSVAEYSSKEFTITPDEGYEIADVTVDGKSVGAVKSYTFTTITGGHSISVAFKKVVKAPEKPEEPTEPETPKYENPFVDVNENQWFYDSVMYVYNHGLMSGVSSEKFNPQEKSSRGMIVTILYTLAGKPEIAANKLAGENGFKDVADGQWYADAIAWAAENKIVSGYGDDTFGPNDNITREQMAVIFYNYAKHQGYDLSETSSLEGFTDNAKISNWASDAMQWMVGAGMMSGKGNNILDPKGTATRAEMATIMKKFAEKY